MAQIKTYCRIKPTKNISRFYDWDKDSVRIGVRPPGASGASDDRTTVTHDTEFSHVFGPTVMQSEVFDVVASNVVEGCLAGYNGTIFAYGQTGSGKTYTIEGGSKTYADRGIAPRALSAVYKCIRSMTAEYDITIHVSYLEIYQETGFDLLNPTARMSGVVAHLPKVSVRDGPGSTCIIRNLSTHLAADEDIAQSLLHQGRVSRHIAATPMNQRSSRSHAIFTIYMTLHDRKADVVRKSKLHLVDLAGSERVAKSRITGSQLAEAKSINLSLHHLEGVIITLQKMSQGERKERRPRSSSAGPFRQKRINSAASTRSLPYGRRSTGELTNPRHVPYRNSLLTMLLKDSLGGNCLTAMVATLSVEDINIGESLSTCRFARRVACVKNHASRNEEIDDRMVIKRLRKRVVDLEKEIKSLKETEGRQSVQQETEKVVNVICTECKQMQRADAPLNSQGFDATEVPASNPVTDRETRKLCVKVMHGFIGGKIKDPVGAGMKNETRFRVCLGLLREMLMRSYAVGERSKSKHLIVEHQHSESKESTRIRSKSSPNLQSANVPRNESFVSPFEKKRENAIQRVGARVDRKHTDLKLQKKNLLEFQTNIREQQLLLLQKELNGKVLKLKSQIARQRSLLHNLKEGLGDAGEIEMERTALKQLIKRGTRYENRLQVVSEQLKIIDQHNQLQNRAEVNTSRTDAEELRNNEQSTKDRPIILSGEFKSDCRSEGLVATDGLKESLPFTEKSGRINTRKVLGLLKKEERKQDEIQSVLDEVRFESVSSHLALKEQATRQKLREFKEKLQQSKRAGIKTSSSDSTAAGYLSKSTVTDDNDSKHGRNCLESNSSVNAYLSPKNQPKSAWNTRQEYEMHKDTFNDMTTYDPSTTDVQKFQKTSPDHQSSSGTLFDSTLDSMLQDVSVGSSTPGSTTSTITSRASSASTILPMSSQRTDNASKQEPNDSFVKKSHDFSELQQKLSKYLGFEQPSSPKTRPLAMANINSVSRGSINSATSITSFGSTSQEKLSAYFTESPSHSTVDPIITKSSLQGSVTTLNPSDTFLYDRGSLSFGRASLPFDRGSLPFDRESLPFDRASLPFDRVSLPFDGASLPFDRVSLSFDSASLPFDGGSLQIDRANLPFDRGSLPFDGASLSFDRKSLPFDRTSNRRLSSTESIQSDRTIVGNHHHLPVKNDTLDLLSGTPDLKIPTPVRKGSFPTASVPKPSHSEVAMEDKEREVSFIKAVKENKLRVKKIRQAQKAAGIIQTAWKSYVKRKNAEV